MRPRDLAKSALQTVSLDRRVAILRHNEPDTYMTHRGSSDSELETFRPNALPLFPDSSELGIPRQLGATREREPFMRRRTSSAV